MAFVNKISNEEVAALEAVRFDGEIIVVDNDMALERACIDLASHPVLGFDTETRPSFKAGVTNKVALLQLSTYERCYLIRLCRVKISTKLRGILESKFIVKIGADVAGDIRSLRKLYPLSPHNFVDLQSEIGKYGIEDKSLRKMSGIVLGKRVSKAQRLSNWEAQTLTEQQQMYAATDAWVCLKIYDKLNEK